VVGAGGRPTLVAPPAAPMRLQGAPRDPLTHRFLDPAHLLLAPPARISSPLETNAGPKGSFSI